MRGEIIDGGPKSLFHEAHYPVKLTRTGVQGWFPRKFLNVAELGSETPSDSNGDMDSDTGAGRGGPGSDHGRGPDASGDGGGSPSGGFRDDIGTGNYSPSFLDDFFASNSFMRLVDQCAVQILSEKMEGMHIHQLPSESPEPTPNPQESPLVAAAPPPHDARPSPRDHDPSLDEGTNHSSDADSGSSLSDDCVNKEDRDTDGDGRSSEVIGPSLASSVANGSEKDTFKAPEVREDLGKRASKKLSAEKTSSAASQVCCALLCMY